MKPIWLGGILAMNIFATENFVNVSGEHFLEVMPDEAFITCGVSKTHKRVDSAVGGTSRVSGRIFEISRKYGIEKDDIGTEVTGLEREYRNNRDTSTYVGVLSRQIYRIRVRRLDSISEFMNELYANGMNDLREISFRYSKEDSVKRSAGEWAMMDALENAKALVRNQGRKLGKLLSASYEKPEDFDVRVTGKVEDLGALWRGDAGPPNRKMNLEYLKILPKKIRIHARAFAKYEIK